MPFTGHVIRMDSIAVYRKTYLGWTPLQFTGHVIRANYQRRIDHRLKAVNNPAVVATGTANFLAGGGSRCGCGWCGIEEEVPPISKLLPQQRRAGS